MDSSLPVPLSTNVEVKIEEEEEAEDPLDILGIDSVYNARCRSSTKSLLTNLTPGLRPKLKCTTWRCRKCNVDFPTQSDIIQHVQQKSCIPQDPLNTNTKLFSATPAPPEESQTPQPQILRLQPPCLDQPQPTATATPTDDQQNIKYQSCLARNRVAAKHRRLNETPQQREARLTKATEYSRLRRQKETEEERETRLSKDAERDRRRRANETEEEREVRQRKLRQYQKTRVLTETKEERETRLHKKLEYYRNHRGRANLNSPPPLPALKPTRKPKRVESLKPRVSTPNMSHSQHSYTPSPCKICGKSVPLRYMKLHYLHHSELEYEKTGVWSRAEDWTPPTKIQTEKNLEDVGKEFNCSACKSSFSQQVLLTMHIRQAHDNDNSGSQPQLQCTRCSKVFKDMATLKKHQFKVHALPPPPKCDP